ncbi:HNH endonuclease [soil metagenome]
MANNWTREELIIAFNLYCKIPFSKTVKNNPKVIEVANLIGRTPSSVAFKLGNFGSFDPELKKRGIVGLRNAGKLDKEIWDEFIADWDTLAYESELLISKRKNQLIKENFQIETEIPIGKEKERIVRTRVNQSFFRASVLSLYNQKCCITGLGIPDLLIASHIIPWSKDENNRLNPRNGLCLNAIHDRAFDKGLITVTPDYKVKISNYFSDCENTEAVSDMFSKYNNQKIILPDKFSPDREFLTYHNEKVFRK